MRSTATSNLPANATAKLGQTSLLGSLHIELAPPTDAPPEGKLHNGSLIPLSSAAPTRPPSRHWRRCRCCSTAAASARSRTSPRRSAPRSPAASRTCASLIAQLDKFVRYLNDQKDDIIAATDSLNKLVGQFAAQKPVVDKALKTIPDALAVLKDERDNLADALDAAGQIQRAGRRLGQPDQGKPGPGTQRPRAGAGVTGQRRPGADPIAERPGHLPVPEGDADQMVPRRLRQPDRRLRSDAEPARRGVVHRHPVGGQPDRAGDAVGPHHRPDCPARYTAGNPLVVPYHFDQGP